MANFYEILNQPEYPTISDLRYGEKFKIKMSASEIAQFLNYKDELISNQDPLFTKLCLQSFNSDYIFYSNHVSIKNLYNEYIELVNSDGVFDSNLEEMKRARIYSEVEGSLNIEGYNSTRLIFDKLMAGKTPEGKDEIVIRNMAKAMSFIESAPPFNKDNLFKLYSILSEDVLNKDQILNNGDFYRYGMVYISTYNGAPVEKINSCMDSLFKLVNGQLNSSDQLFKFLLPHIVHYYIVYVHPYFDCNGRTARMASLWVAKLTGIGNSPYFISEAINDSKSKYYHALSRTRDTRNDLTYFLLYILNTSIKYALCYRKMNQYQYKLASAGESMTSSEFGYMKKIILSFDDRFFTWRDFVGSIGTNMSKQGALKTLNRLSAYELIQSSQNRRGEKIFRVTK